MRKSMFGKGLVVAIIVLFVGASVVPSTGMEEKSTMGRGILYVGGSGPGNYTSIQEAINDASDGDTVFVYNGTYHEHIIIINKNYLNLIGENKETTIIDADGYSQGLSIPEYRHHNFVSGLTVMNTTYVGIWMHSEPAHSGAHCDYNTISDCIVRDCSGVGGIRIIGRRWTCHADYNTVINCEVFNISGNGILIHAGEGYSYYNRIINTKCYNNTVGIYVGESQTDGSIISNCTIFNNTECGLKIVSSDTTVYHNNLLNNVQNTFDSGTNTWYNATIQEGNFYSDYNGTDADGDGIGDTPYNISGGSNQDLYPFMYPNGWIGPDVAYVDDDYNETTPGWGYDHFDSIQDGVDAVNENGTVYVYNGIYYEWVESTKNMQLHGEDRETTIIDGTGVMYCLRAMAPANNVVMTNLTTRYSDSIGTSSYASNVIIDSITSYGNTNDYGFYTRSASNITIKNCIAYDNERGLYDSGIGTDDLEVYGCTFRNNTDWGMKTAPGTTNAYYHHNNLLSNGVNAEDVSDGSNLWDYNYYDDYSGVDADGDRIGDTPYNIQGSAGEQDLHPLMYPWGEIPPIANFSYSINGSTVQFDGSPSYDRDGEIISYEWEFDDGTTGQGMIVSHVYDESGTYDVTLIVKDDDGYEDNITKSIEVEVPNQPPGVPIINGPASGKAGETYSYTFVAVDPDDNDVFYYIDWGDGTVEDWFGPYPSDVQIIVNHSWSEKGDYTIMARAKDTHGAIGNWSTLEVTMPKNKPFFYNSPLLNWLMERFPLIQRLLIALGVYVV